MEIVSETTQTSDRQYCPVRREPHLSHTPTRKHCVCESCKACEVRVLFTPPVADKEIAVACKRNTLQGETNYRSYHSSDGRQAGLSAEAGHQVADEEATRFRPTYPSPLFPIYFRSLTFFDWSASESSVLKDIRIWTLCLFSHNQNFALVLDH